MNDAPSPHTPPATSDEASASARASGHTFDDTPAQASAPTPGMPDERTLMEKLGAAGPLAIASAILPLLGSLVLFANADAVRDALRAQGELGWATFVIGFAVLSGLALLPTYAQSGMAGYIFGAAWGAAGAVLGCVGGALIGYVVARTVAGERVKRAVHENPKWKAASEALLGESHSLRRTTGMVSLIRLPPNSPFAITNLAMAGLRVRPDAYMIGTLVGITPRTVLAAFIGAGVQETFTRESWSQAMPPVVFYGAIGLGLVVVFIIGRIAMRAVDRAAQQAGGTPST
ncbi:MAG: VTT domain-containing protein [Planctomycetota bacterium]|nr:VTT domain-containing protein [Planctomycetota bacterium]